MTEKQAEALVRWEQIKCAHIRCFSIIWWTFPRSLSLICEPEVNHCFEPLCGLHSTDAVAWQVEMDEIKRCCVYKKKGKSRRERKLSTCELSHLTRCSHVGIKPCNPEHQSSGMFWTLNALAMTHRDTSHCWPYVTQQASTLTDDGP